MNERDYADAAMAGLLAQAKKQFGNAIKGFWFYDGDPCPGCGFSVDVMQHKGQDALSLNTFIYRPRRHVDRLLPVQPLRPTDFQGGRA